MYRLEIIWTYGDPLIRQLNEAIQIAKQGTLNGKFEFGVNEICELSCNSSSREQMEQVKTELVKRQVDKNKLQNFIEIMSEIGCLNNQFINNSRSSKRKTFQPVGA